MPEMTRRKAALLALVAPFLPYAARVVGAVPQEAQRTMPRMSPKMEKVHWMVMSRLPC